MIGRFSNGQIRNEHHMAFGAHFLFDARPLIDFELGNERYGCRSGTSATGRCSLHKLCARPGSGFSLYKMFDC